MKLSYICLHRVLSVIYGAFYVKDEKARMGYSYSGTHTVAAFDGNVGGRYHED